MNNIFSLFLNDVKLSQKCKSVGKLFQITGAQSLKARVAPTGLHGRWNGKKRTRCGPQSHSSSCDVMRCERVYSIQILWR